MFISKKQKDFITWEKWWNKNEFTANDAGCMGESF